MNNGENIKQNIREKGSLEKLAEIKPPASPKMSHNTWRLFNVMKVSSRWMSRSEISQRTGIHASQFHVLFGKISDAGYIVEQHPEKILFRLKRDDKRGLVRNIAVNN